MTSKRGTGRRRGQCSPDIGHVTTEILRTEQEQASRSACSQFTLLPFLLHIPQTQLAAGERNSVVNRHFPSEPPCP